MARRCRAEVLRQILQTGSIYRPTGRRFKSASAPLAIKALVLPRLSGQTDTR